MRPATLALLRCPYCGGRITPRTDLFQERVGDRLISGVLSCHCTRFPVVSGVAVMTVEGVTETARELIEAGEAARACRTLFAAGDDELAARYDAIATDTALTYKDVVAALGPDFAEGRYFLYRFSDPTFVAADGVVRALSAALADDDRPAVDICGGSGHLTRTLSRFGARAPVLMDWSFAKLWLASRFTVPAAELVCADAHTALPFAPGAFRLAVCSDAFHYIWSKALLAHEMIRIAGDRGVVAVTHAHNALQPNESTGMPLPPAGYADLFEASGGRCFSERALLADVMKWRVDLRTCPPEAALEEDPALTIIASRREGIFAVHPLLSDGDVDGDLRINPLYAIEPSAQGAELTLVFPSDQYEKEFGHCRTYLPERLTLDGDTLAAIAKGSDTPRTAALRARRVLLDLPRGFC